MLVAAESPRGATVFKDLLTSPPVSEEEFVSLWKLYIITVVAQKMREFHIADHSASRLYGVLEAEGLLEPGSDLFGILRRVQRFVKAAARIRPQVGMEIEPETLMPSYNAKLLLSEPAHELREKGYSSIDEMFRLANKALTEHDFKVWALFDRLDVAFADDHALEANALRALFRVYGDMRAYGQIELKVFLREDIWTRIFSTGFREASHLNRYVLLDWQLEALRNLMIRRVLNNPAFVAEFDIQPKEILGSIEAQAKFVERFLPKDIEQGKTATFSWMVSRCADATRKTAPREIIHLLKSLLEREIQRLERGGSAAPGDQLFDRSVFKDALGSVSHARLHQYIYAEYPDYKEFISMLERAKAEQTAATLAEIWSVDQNQAAQTADKLVEIGFFERRGSKDNYAYWVPFLYRDSLELVQGRA